MAVEPTNPTPQREWERDDFARHRLLSIAIPFPERLDWLTPEGTAQSLNVPYDYADELATSVIDWYLQHRRAKKIQSVGLRYASYVFAIIGVAVPLVKIFNEASLEHIFGRFAGDVSNIAVEAALVLLAIAGGLHAVDRLIGASSAWMRYISTAIGLQNELLRFRFEWNKIAGEKHFTIPPASSGAGGASTGQNPPPEVAGALTLQGAKFKLIYDFCMNVIDVVRVETGIWSTEVAEALDKFEKTLSSTPFRQSGR